MRKWLFPVDSAIISVFLLLVVFVLGVSGNGDGTGYGGVMIALGGIILCCVIACLQCVSGIPSVACWIKNSIFFSPFTIRFL